MVNQLLKTALGRLRIVAFIEGCSYLLLGFTMILKYKLTAIKKKIYGKIKGKKIYIDDIELLYRHYDYDRF
jgi:hypothetical protein